jgi:hypothetical protein
MNTEGLTQFAVRFQHEALSRGGRRRSSPPGNARAEGFFPDAVRGAWVAWPSRVKFSWHPFAEALRLNVGRTVATSRLAPFFSIWLPGNIPAHADAISTAIALISDEFIATQ